MLAGHLGKTLEELETGRPAPLSSMEFSLWQEFWWKHPFGDERIAIGLLSCIVANANRGKDVQPYSLEQFIPTRPLRETTDNQSVHEQKAFAEAIVAALGGRGE